MEARGVIAPQASDRRRFRRIRLAVPVRYGTGIASEGHEVCPRFGESSDLSTGGIAFTTKDPGSFSPGEVLEVSITIPWEARRAFPFSRILGRCRVVRVEERPAEGGATLRRVALEFCGDQVTLLGAIVVPR
jgi:c-di-GMP-binding flagellar brake protein YcgR